MQYAEEYSASHAIKMSTHGSSYLKLIPDDQVAVKSITAYKSVLGRESERRIGSVRGFWLSCYGASFPDIGNESASIFGGIIFNGK